MDTILSNLFRTILHKSFSLINQYIKSLYLHENKSMIVLIQPAETKGRVWVQSPRNGNWLLSAELLLTARTWWAPSSLLCATVAYMPWVVPFHLSLPVCSETQVLGLASWAQMPSIPMSVIIFHWHVACGIRDDEIPCGWCTLLWTNAYISCDSPLRENRLTIKLKATTSWFFGSLPTHLKLVCRFSWFAVISQCQLYIAGVGHNSATPWNKTARTKRSWIRKFSPQSPLYFKQANPH